MLCLYLMAINILAYKLWLLLPYRNFLTLSHVFIIKDKLKLRMIQYFKSQSVLIKLINYQNSSRILLTWQIIIGISELQIYFISIKMSQKNTRHYYKISSLSPPFIQSPLNKSQRKKSYSTNRIPNLDTFSNFIEQLPEQYKESIQFSKSNKNQINVNHQRIQSYNQVGGKQCKPFKNKIMLKRNQLERHSNLLDRKQEVSDNQLLRQQYLDNKAKSTFVEQYRINLRRTVFNQTKMMMKNKKNNKSKLKYDFYAIEESAKVRDYEKQLQYSKILANKNSFHSHKVKFGSQRLSSTDTMYKTIVKRDTDRPQIMYQELDVAKFPLLMRTKNESNPNLNYSNLLMALNMRHSEVKQTLQLQNKKNKKIGRVLNRDNNFQRHQIKPWQTYADQFTD